MLNKSKEIADAISNFEEIDLDSINHFLEITINFDPNIFNQVRELIDLSLLDTKVQKASDLKLYSLKHKTETKQKLNLLVNQLGLGLELK